MKKTIYTILAGAALTLASCTTDVFDEILHNESDRITFTATTDNEAATRAAGVCEDLTPVNFEGTQAERPLVLSPSVTVRQQPAKATRGHRFGDDANDELTAFRVSAIQADANISAEDFADATPNLFYNLKAEKNDQDVFDIDQDYYWPASSEKLWFYAYTPCDDANVVVSSQDTGGPQKVTLTVNSDVTNQIDLMTADATTTAFNSVTGDAKKSSVNLTFRHELTAIRFVIGEQWLAGSIKSIAIKNVHGVGTLTIGNGSQWAWTDKNGNPVTANNSYTLTLNKGGLSGTEGEEFIDDTDLYFLMIPQSFADNDDACIEVKYQDLAKEYTVTAPLKGQDAWVRNTTVTYAISSHALTTLKIGTIAWPTGTTWTSPKTAFNAEGDSIGLYVVDPDGSTIPENRRNIKCTYDGTSWTIHHPANAPVYKLPGYQYFFYYPYTPTPDTKYPVTGQGTTDTEAAAFFSTLVNGWNPALQQNSRDKLDRQDLQIAKGIADQQAYSTVNAQMVHQMNMAVITLGTKNDVPNDVTLQLDANYQWHHGADGTKTNVPASASFGDRKPFNNTADNKYYYVFKPGTSDTEIKGILSDNTTVDWSYIPESASRGVKVEETVQTSRSTFPVTKDYTLQTGDVLYSDGALSRNTAAAHYGDRTAIALVFATSTSTTDNKTYGWKHGYALSIRKISGYLAWAASATQQVLIGNAYAPANVQADKDGYQHCKDVQDAASNYGGLGQFPAINATLSYKARNKDNTADVELTEAISSSKWYLPSAGQWVDVFKNLGGYNNNPVVLSDRLGFAWENGTFGTAAQAACNTAKTNFDAKITVLENAGYSGLSPLKSSEHSGYWTSTQRDNEKAYEIYFMSYCDIYPYNKTHSSGGDNWCARPCLAF